MLTRELGRGYDTTGGLQRRRCYGLQPAIARGIYFGHSIIVMLLFKYDIIRYQNGSMIFDFVFIMVKKGVK